MDAPEKPEHILQFFRFAHLPAHLQAVSEPFSKMAHSITATLPANPERAVALRKLLEAKDAAVRALIGKDVEWDPLALRWVETGVKTGPAISHAPVGA
jgi:hypothetical protein